MTVLPIVSRELRVASRRRTTYLVRSGGAGAILLLGAWFFLMLYRESPQQLAMILFAVTSGGATLYAWLSGLRATSDCLSQEKRDGTMGLLFLTDLRGYDVVLGKLAANSVNVVYGVTATVPILAVPLLMGGVTPGEFGRAALVALNTLFLSLSIGMWASSVSRDPRRAAGLTFALLLLFTAALPAAAGWLANARKLPGVWPLLLLPSPGYAHFLAYAMNFPGHVNQFWISNAVIHGIAWLGLVGASIALPQTWQDRSLTGGVLRWRDRWHNWQFGDSVERARRRRELLDANPFFWLAARSRFKHALVWLVLALLGACWVWGLARWRRDWLNEGTYVATGIILNLLIKGWFASEASRQLAEERQQGTLELLLTTPLGVERIVRGQSLALQRQFLGPVLFVLVMAGLLMAAGLPEMRGVSDHNGWLAFWIGMMIMLVADLTAMFWVGLWQGLTARNASRAASATISRILVLPWLIYAFFLLMVVLGSMGRGPEPGWLFLFGLWFILGLGTDIGFGLAARDKVISQFRAEAARRYETRRSFWAWFSGR